MLYHIAVRPFPEQPAGEIAPPFAVRCAANIKLNESAGFLDILPRRGCLARLEADDGVTRAQGFAGFHPEVGSDAVTLVEQADHCHPFGHGGAGKGRGTAVADFLPLDTDRTGLVRRGQIVAAAGREQGKAAQGRQDGSRRVRHHDASGLHAS